MRDWWREGLCWLMILIPGWSSGDGEPYLPLERVVDDDDDDDDWCSCVVVMVMDENGFGLNFE